MTTAAHSRPPTSAWATHADTLASCRDTTGSRINAGVLSGGRHCNAPPAAPRRHCRPPYHTPKYKSCAMSDTTAACAVSPVTSVARCTSSWSPPLSPQQNRS
eukprot:1804964-Rhodomonas_salina.1